MKKNIQVFPSSYAQLNPLVYVSCMEQVSSLTAVQTIDVKHEWKYKKSGIVEDVW